MVYTNWMIKQQHCSYSIDLIWVIKDIHAKALVIPK